MLTQDMGYPRCNTVTDFPQQSLDLLSEQVVVVDRHGVIIAVNEAWNRFARANGDPDRSTIGVGVNYLEVCRRYAREERGAREAHYGLSFVLEGLLERFSIEYLCHLPQGQRRWFSLTITPLRGEQYGAAMLTHKDITTRILAKKAWESLVLEQEKESPGPTERSQCGPAQDCSPEKIACQA